MWELDCKESWALKNWCFRTLVLEKTLESPLDFKEIKLLNPQGNHCWIFLEGWCLTSNTLATWCEELTHLKRLWCWKRLKAEEEGDNRGWLYGITDSMGMRFCKLQVLVIDREVWHAAVNGVTKSQTWLRDRILPNCTSTDNHPLIINSGNLCSYCPFSRSINLEVHKMC